MQKNVFVSHSTVPLHFTNVSAEVFMEVFKIFKWNMKLQVQVTLEPHWVLIKSNVKPAVS